MQRNLYTAVGLSCEKQLQYGHAAEKEPAEGVVALEWSHLNVRDNRQGWPLV
jgi:hypothetical protein